MSPTPNKSFGSTRDQNSVFNKRETHNEERKLSGSGTYKIDAALQHANHQDEDED